MINNKCALNRTGILCYTAWDPIAANSVLSIELENYAASANTSSALVWDPTNALNALQGFLTLPSSYSMLLLALAWLLF